MLHAIQSRLIQFCETNQLPKVSSLLSRITHSFQKKAFVFSGLAVSTSYGFTGKLAHCASSPDQMSDIAPFTKGELREKEPNIFKYLYREDFTESGYTEVNKLTFENKIKFVNALLKLGRERIKEAERKDVSLIVGQGRTGKSLYFCWLIGSKITKDPRSSKNYIVEGKSPSLVSRRRSCTILPVIQPIDGLLLVDTPGTEDTRGPEIPLVNSILMKELVEKGKAASFTMVVNDAYIEQNYIGWGEVMTKFRDRYGYSIHDIEAGKTPLRLLVNRAESLQEAREHLDDEINSPDASATPAGRLGSIAFVYDPEDLTMRDHHIEKIIQLTQRAVEPRFALTGKELEVCQNNFAEASRQLNSMMTHDSNMNLKQVVQKSSLYMNFIENIRAFAGRNFEVNYQDVKKAYAKILSTYGEKDFQAINTSLGFQKVIEENEEVIKRWDSPKLNVDLFKRMYKKVYQPTDNVPTALSLTAGVAACTFNPFLGIGVFLGLDATATDQKICHIAQDIWGRWTRDMTSSEAFLAQHMENTIEKTAYLKLQTELQERGRLAQIYLSQLELSLKLVQEQMPSIDRTQIEESISELNRVILEQKKITISDLQVDDLKWIDELLAKEQEVSRAFKEIELFSGEKGSHFLKAANQKLEQILEKMEAVTNDLKHAATNFICLQQVKKICDEERYRDSKLGAITKTFKEMIPYKLVG